MKKLSYTSPHNIIKNNNEANEFDDFFLILSLIFNDLKGLIIFHQLCGEKYKIDNPNAITFDNGELAGLRLQIIRLMIGTLKEAITFINNRKVLISGYKFKLIEKNIGPNKLESWNKICKLAFSDKIKNDKSFLSTIHGIRNDLSYHYDKKAPEILRSSFREKFYKDKETESNKYCYYANTFQMYSSRFCYCDAAIEKYLETELLNEKDYFNELLTLIENLNSSILFLMDGYLKNK